MAHEEDTCQTNVRSSQSRCVATTGPQLTPKLPRSGGHLSKPANNSTKLTARQCSFLPNWRKPTGNCAKRNARPTRGSALASNSSCDPRRSEEHTSELQSRGHLVCRLLLDK